MAKGFGRFRLLTRRPSGQDQPPGDGLVVDGDGMALESAALEPPVLLPAAIFRQLLVNPAEIAPAWLRPRPASAAVPTSSSRTTAGEGADANASPTEGPAPAKRNRRPDTIGSSGAKGTTSRRVRKPKRNDSDR